MEQNFADFFELLATLENGGNRSQIDSKGATCFASWLHEAQTFEKQNKAKAQVLGSKNISTEKTVWAILHAISRVKAARQRVFLQVCSLGLGLFL